jgi:Flp pilus assembly protein TadB
VSLLEFTTWCVYVIGTIVFWLLLVVGFVGIVKLCWLLVVRWTLQISDLWVVWKQAHAVEYALVQFCRACRAGAYPCSEETLKSAVEFLDAVGE